MSINRIPRHYVCHGLNQVSHRMEALSCLLILQRCMESVEYFGVSKYKVISEQSVCPCLTFPRTLCPNKRIIQCFALINNLNHLFDSVILRIHSVLKSYRLFSKTLLFKTCLFLVYLTLCVPVSILSSSSSHIIQHFNLNRHVDSC